jgi:trimeric autotransporter adhesin
MLQSYARLVVKAQVYFFFLILFCNHHISAQNIIITVAGNGGYGYYGDGGFADTAQLANPKGVCADRHGNIYIADQGNNVIRKVAAGTGFITTIAGTGAAGYYGDGGLADTAVLNAPAAVFVDDSDNIFIADWGNDVVREIVDSTGVIITVAGNGNAGYNGDGIYAPSAELWGPGAVFVDKTGNLYIADTYNSRIRKVDTNLIITTVAGDTLSGYTGDGGLADTASLDNPYGIAVDTAGNIFIACGNVIRKVDAATGIINTIAGNANAGYTGDGGPAINAQLNQPEGICVDVSGNLFIADYYNNVVREINNQTGIISTYAGSSDTSVFYGGDGGPADSAVLNGPTGVFMNSTGFLYLADNINNRIREVGPGLVQWTGVGELKNFTVNIYPNPGNGHITVATGGLGAEYSFRVLNSVGQLVYSSELKAPVTQIDLSSLSSGIYFARLQSSLAGYTQKIILTGN